MLYVLIMACRDVWNTWPRASGHHKTRRGSRRVLWRPEARCVKYMARGHPESKGHVFHTSRQAMIKTYYSTSIKKNVVQNCSYFTQIKSTTTAIDDSLRRRNKIWLGCSREATAPLILIFKSMFRWINIDRYLKGLTHFYNRHSPKLIS